MKWRRLTRLEGMLLGALVELTDKSPITRDDDGIALCHKGLCTADECGRCGPILRAKDLVAKVLKMQRTPPKKRTARKPAPRGFGRGGHRVGERRQAARTVHIIDADSSARDVELARTDLANFFGDVLHKHHGGGS